MCFRSPHLESQRLVAFRNVKAFSVGREYIVADQNRVTNDKWLVSVLTVYILGHIIGGHRLLYTRAWCWTKSYTFRKCKRCFILGLILSSFALVWRIMPCRWQKQPSSEPVCIIWICLYHYFEKNIWSAFHKWRTFEVVVICCG